MKSLLISSVPKSFSTPLYRILQNALELQPTPASRHGEVLSLLENGMEVLYGEGDARAIADHFLQWNQGYLLKDVLAPGVMKYLAKDFNILGLQRPAADVVYLRLYRQPFKWELMLLPPSLASGWQPTQFKTLDSRDANVVKSYLPYLVDGILWAQAQVRASASALVHYDKIVSKPESLWEALRALGYKPGEYQYITREFRRVRDDRLRVRRTREYKQIQQIVERRRLAVETAWRHTEGKEVIDGR